MKLQCDSVSIGFVHKLKKERSPLSGAHIVSKLCSIHDDFVSGELAVQVRATSLHLLSLLLKSWASS